MGVRIRIDPIQLEAACAAQTETWFKLRETGKTAVEHWQQIAPEGDKEHTLKSGFVVKPGDYRDSIRATTKTKNGRKYVRVQAHDFKAGWLEYGSVHNAPGGYAAAVRAFLLSHGCRNGKAVE